MFYRKYALSYLPKFTSAVFDYLENVPWKFENTQGRGDKCGDIVTELKKLVKRHMEVPKK